MQRVIQIPEVRQAAQAAIGVALAIGAGTLISGQRWYWAVIAAFIVGLGVGSRSEAVIKGLQRLVGTLAGIAIGIALASAVSGHTNLALGLVLVCVFFAFYAFQAAYGAMTFCITLMLALLYGLLGQFQPHLLVLRLEETAAGAAVGILVTMLVLPIRQSEVFRKAAQDFVAALAETVKQIRGADPRSAQQALRELQSKGQALRNSVAGIKRGWVPLVPMYYRRAVRAATRCNYLVRELAHERGLSRNDCAAILQRIDSLQQALERGENRQAGEADAVSPPASERARENLRVAAVLQALDRFGLRLQQALGGA